MRGPYLFVSGRWDNVVSVVDVAAALKAGPGGSPAAIVSRPRVTPDIDGGTGRAGTPASGQPVNLVIAADRRFAYVVNHSGRATPAAAAAFQHGHPGLIAVLDVAKALDPANNGTTNAIVDLIETGTAGPVGIALTPDGQVSASCPPPRRRAARTAAGDHRSSTSPRGRSCGRSCRRSPATASRARRSRAPHPAPHETFGDFPNANGVAVSPLEGGVIFAGNGGTDDVSVIGLARALAGDPGAELARVPVEAGPFGLAVSPDGSLCAVANRESAPHRRRGQHDLAHRRRPRRRRRRPRRARARPGRHRSRGRGDAALRRRLHAGRRQGRRDLLPQQHRLARRRRQGARRRAGRGASRRLHRRRTAAPAARAASRCCRTASTSRSSAAPKARPGSSLVWIVDLKTLSPRACVTGVGNESYLLRHPGRASAAERRSRLGSGARD